MVDRLNGPRIAQRPLPTPVAHPEAPAPTANEPAARVATPLGGDRTQFSRRDPLAQGPQVDLEALDWSAVGSEDASPFLSGAIEDLAAQRKRLLAQSKHPVITQALFDRIDALGDYMVAVKSKRAEEAKERIREELLKLKKLVEKAIQSGDVGLLLALKGVLKQILDHMSITDPMFGDFKELHTEICKALGDLNALKSRERLDKLKQLMAHARATVLSKELPGIPIPPMPSTPDFSVVSAFDTMGGGAFFGGK